MRKEDFSDEAIKEKLTRLYKKSPFYRPKYNGAKVDTNMTPKKTLPKKLFETQIIPPGTGDAKLDERDRLRFPRIRKNKSILTQRKKIQTSDGYLLT